MNAALPSTSTAPVDAHTGPSFSRLNRIMRVLWQLVNLVFFRLSPPPCHAWRVWLLRLFGAKIGRGAHVYPGAVIWAPWNLEVGEEAGIANGVIIYCQGRITIGRRAVISQGAHLCAGTHDFEEPGFPLITKPIVIKDHAWIAAEAFIHPGVTVPEGCVVGARSVVTSQLEPWTVCSGFPAKVLRPRHRYLEEQVEKPTA
ncbi:MAG: putative colanic acid biosynthesis acetyltransferase [Opitutales bacterium]